MNKLAGSYPRDVDSGSLIDVVAYATIAFLYEREPGRSVDRVLARLGQCLDVDHVVLVPLDPAQEARSWSAGPPGDWEAARKALADAEEWMRQLGQGSVVPVTSARARQTPPGALKAWGAASLCLAPLFVNSAWWGVLVIVDGKRPRHWSRAHGKALLAIAATLGAGLQADFDNNRLSESRANLISARRSAQTYRSRLDELILASQDAILVIEADGFVSRCNESAHRLFGSRLSRRPGNSFQDYFPLSIRQTVATMVGEARSGCATHARAVDVASGTGCRNLLLSTFPLGDARGTVAVVARDQTETVLYRDKLEHSLAAAIEALASAVEARDPYTAGHQRRAAALARRIAMAMGLPEEEARGVYTAAIIHDIGKIRVPAEILTCPRRLEPAEMDLIRLHPQAGHDIVSSIDFPWPVAKVILQHHEKVDGSGYPNGLKGEAIHLGARILGVADVVEAITNHRPYRAALGLEAARVHLQAGRGTAFDPAVVDACLDVVATGGI